MKNHEKKISFGTVFTDHMFVMEWHNAEWQNARIQKYQDFTLNPASANFHYGQEIFEGMKAFKTIDERAVLFRPRDHLERMNRSAHSMCMPMIDVDMVLAWLKKLIEKDQAWIPQERGTSLYIRPTMIALDEAIYLKPASHYLFFIILSPVGALYEQGFNPIPILVSERYTRASRGGVGQAKAAGNYGASMRALQEAQSVNCAQVLWLDPVERRYVEEVGAMNIFFVVNMQLVTPMLTDSILAGITRRSIIELCKAKGTIVQERPISIDEVVEGIKNGSVTEIFGSGTAAAVSPVGSLRYKGEVYTVNKNEVGSMTKQLLAALTDIQYGVVPNENSWLEELI